MSDGVATRTESAGEDSSLRHLYVEFEARMTATSCCPLLNIDCSVVDVRQQLAESKCRLDARLSDADSDWPEEPTRIEHATTTIDGDCPCPVFAEYDTIPHVTELTDEAIVIETYLPDREHLTGLVTDLRAVVENVSIRRLKRVDSREDDDRRKFVTIDLYELTDKQRQAVTAAVAAGYYETPREVTLGELAGDMDLSKSALSQRLKAAESKLATAAFSRASVRN